MVGILSGAMGGASINIVIRAIDNYSKEFNKLDKGLKKQQSSFKKLGIFLKSTGLGYAVLAGAVAGLAVTSVKSFLEQEIAAQSFNAILDDLANTMLVDLRKASKGLVSDFNLINSANKAMALGIDKNKLPQLLKTAAALGKTTGRTVTQAFEDISLGIGRQSRLILDNLGIIIDLDETYTEYAKTIGKTKDNLTEFERKMAVTNSVIERGERIMRLLNTQTETHSEKLQRLGATYDNFKVKLGTAIVDFFDLSVNVAKVATAYDLWTNDIQSPEVTKALEEQFDEWDDINNKVQEARQSVKDYILELKGISDAPFVDILEIEKQIAETELDLIRLAGTPFEEGIQTELDNLKELLDEKRAEKDLILKTIEFEEAKRASNRQTTGEALTNIKTIIDNLVVQEAEVNRLQEEENAWFENNKNITDEVVTNWDRVNAAILRALETLNSFSGAGGLRGTSSLLGIGGFGFGGIKIPGFQKGGVVQETGPALVHKGETIIPSNKSGTTIINIENLSGLDPEEISRALSNELNSKMSL